MHQSPKVSCLTICYLGHTSSTWAILEGTFDFPPEMDPHTRLLLEEAHRIFSNKSTKEISNFVSTSDFQYFWKHADEFIQSSYSNVHFGHCKAIAIGISISQRFKQLNSHLLLGQAFPWTAGDTALLSCLRRSLGTFIWISCEQFVLWRPTLTG